MRSFKMAVPIAAILAVAVLAPARAAGVDMAFPITNAAGKDVEAVFVAPVKPGDENEGVSDLSRTAAWRPLDLGGKPLTNGATVGARLQSDAEICEWHVLFTFTDKTDAMLFQGALMPCVFRHGAYKMTLSFDEKLRALKIVSNYRVEHLR
jgi:hypothetical protein